MRLLLSLRDSFSRFYGKHDTAVRLLLKFLTAFMSFCAINQVMGQSYSLSGFVIAAAMAALCAFLPSNSILLMGAVIILIHFYHISLEAAIAGGGILLICMLLYFSIAPMSAFPLILGAFCTGFGIPAVPAVFFGLTGGPLSAVGVGFGVITYYLLRIVRDQGGSLTAVSPDAADAMVEKMVMLINLVISNREMLLTAFAAVILLWIVWMIHQAEFQYSWITAALIGLLFYLGGILMGAYRLEIQIDIMMLVVDAAAALILAWMVQTMLYHLDFKKTENVRFEDDEYFYYVKAVPKRKIIRKKRLRRSERR